MRNPEIRLHHDELIIDCFAGGGGASLGIEQALGRSPDIAINHDAEALVMHRANHPLTTHYHEDVYDVDPCAVCQGRPVGLAWFSPDCTHHSKARNGAIKRDKRVRCLANVVHNWARAVRPRIILLECVEELADWGPLDEDGMIVRHRRGESFQLWWKRLEHMGYQVSMRMLRACDYGAPTSRKRLFIIARCDGIDPETCWPEPTHGPGRDLPHRTAAECIDYGLPCPSIFMSKSEARAFTKATGIRCKRPLVDKTMQRIRRGIFKFVLGCAKPFTIRLTGDDPRVYDIDQPMRTVTAADRGEFAFVAPLVTPVKTWGGGGNDAAPADRPMRTITTSKRGEYAVVAPTLIQTGYGERPGQAPRCLDIHQPLGTIIAGGGGNGNGKHALVAAYLYKGFSDDNRGGGFTGGQDLRKPTGAVTCRDHHQLAVSHLVKFRGTSESHVDASSRSAESPLPTISAGGYHFAEVRAFLTNYHGAKRESDGRGTDLGLPVPTLDTSNRFGLVTIEGEDYQIADIGMRMLEPRELYRAQGFPDSYIIDPIIAVKRNGAVKRLSKTGQVEKCGNSVPPPIARAIVLAAVTAAVARVAA